MSPAFLQQARPRRACRACLASLFVLALAAGATALLLLASSQSLAETIARGEHKTIVATPTGDMPRLPDSLWPGNEKVRGVLEANDDYSRAMAFERMAGGAGTSKRKLDRNAYSHHISTLPLEDLKRFKLGNALFNKLWVSSPASTLASDGLGPFYNGRACESCHAKDGRGHLPSGKERAVSLVVQLANTGVSRTDRTDTPTDGSVKSNDELTPPSGDPVYGVQLHTAAVPGVPAEARVHIRYRALQRQFEDGTVTSLDYPEFSLEELAYGELDPQTRLSPRLAPSIIGQGLLDSIDDDAILAWADPNDSDGNGISGRPNFQRLSVGSSKLGRFGWKAGKSSVLQQSAHAFANDMGLSTSIVSDPNGDCTEAQTICNSLAHGVQKHLGDAEVPDALLELVAFYASNLAVPARRDVGDPTVLRGKQLFSETGCVQCHIPRHVTASDAAQPENQFQLIWPYTDLLLHDMGEELADGAQDEATDGLASGQEWRTAPLWGIGAATTVNPRTRFLHDGRAATPLDAVLWHGGEAIRSRNAVLGLVKADREALARFLDSL